MPFIRKTGEKPPEQRERGGDGGSSEEKDRQRKEMKEREVQAREYERQARERERQKRQDGEAARELGIPTASSWEEELQNPDLVLLQKWQKYHEARISESSTHAIRLERDIHRLYEEMFMVRDWSSVGGWITHEIGRANASDARAFEPLLQQEGITPDDFLGRVDSFIEEYRSVSGVINEVINGRCREEEKVLDDYLRKLQSIRTNPLYEIFFRTHYLSRYFPRKRSYDKGDR